jgi:hypothetical protein
VRLFISRDDLFVLKVSPFQQSASRFFQNGMWPHFLSRAVGLNFKIRARLFPDSHPAPTAPLAITVV